MTINEIVDVIFADIPADKTGEFATALKTKIMSCYSTDQQKIIADQMEQAGIILTNIPCKRHPSQT